VFCLDIHGDSKTSCLKQALECAPTAPHPTPTFHINLGTIFWFLWGLQGLSVATTTDQWLLFVSPSNGRWLFLVSPACRLSSAAPIGCHRHRATTQGGHRSSATPVRFCLPLSVAGVQTFFAYWSFIVDVGHVGLA